MKGILFKEALFNAIVEGRKTQTRRIMEPQPDERGFRTTNSLFEDWHGSEAKPRYNAGEIVYMKEPYIDDLDMAKVFYKFNNKDKAIIDREMKDIKNPWKNKLFMPSDMARCFIKIKKVWPERIAEISEENAIAEGATSKEDFEKLWDSINLKAKWDKNGNLTAYPFQGKTIARTEGNGRRVQVICNPWVWAYEFEFLEGYSLIV